MPRAALLPAIEPIDSVTGRVCYSQQILKEFDWIAEAHGQGVDSPAAATRSSTAGARRKVF